MGDGGASPPGRRGQGAMSLSTPVGEAGVGTLLPVALLLDTDR